MEQLKNMRKKYGLTMKQLGNEIGVAESTISQYESGKREPDYATLIKLANYFNVSIDFLLGREKSDSLTQDISKAESRFEKMRRRINEMRETAGMSMEDLAQKSNIPIETIENIGTGKGASMDIDRLSRIAKVLNTNTDYLLGFSDDSTPPPHSKSISELLSESKPESAVYVFGYNGAREKLTDPEDVESVKAFIKYLKENKNKK